jgi:MFS family permease
LITSDDADAGTRAILLDDAKEIGKAASVVPPRRWWLVLPPLALIVFVTASNPLLMTDLLEHRYEQRYGSHGSTEQQQTNCRQSTSTRMFMYYWPFPFSPPIQRSTQNHSEYSLVQSAVSRFNIKNAIGTLFPSLVVFILLGSNCDTVGRRPLIFLPFVGKIFHNTLLLIIISHDLSDAWLLVSYAIDAVFGSHGLIMLAVLAYISDCTSQSDRTRAFCVVEVIMVVMRVAPMLAVGLWLRRFPHVYITPISVFLVLSVIGILYVMFIQPESVESV